MTNRTRRPSSYRVRLMLYAIGPVRPRTKYKEHKLLRGDGCITLPFPPFPGLYLTDVKKVRGKEQFLYLRVRAVEWLLSKSEFRCIVDEVLCSNVAAELSEARGGWRIQEHFDELLVSLPIFGFDVDANYSAPIALDTDIDGKRFSEMRPF